MDPYSGQMYTNEEVASLPKEVKERLVKVEGKPRDIRRVQQATKHYADVTSDSISKRRAANKRAKLARKRNRGK